MDTHYTDLRHILDDPRWRAGASYELREKLKQPLARRSAKDELSDHPTDRKVAKQIHGDLIVVHDNLVVLNDWIAERTQRAFQCANGYSR